MALTMLVSPRGKATASENAKEAFQNLVRQLPAEATGIYIAAMGFFKDISAATTWLTVAAVVGLIILVWIRARANVSTTIWIMSIVGYILWIYAISDQGPIQAGLKALGIMPPPLLAAFLVFIYSTVVTILAVNPPKKG